VLPQYLVRVMKTRIVRSFFRLQLGKFLNNFREKLAFTLLALEVFPFSPHRLQLHCFCRHAMAAEAPEVTLEADVSPRIVLSIFGQLTKHHLFGNSG
jgi:hypothetical protein